MLPDFILFETLEKRCSNLMSSVIVHDRLYLTGVLSTYFNNFIWKNLSNHSLGCLERWKFPCMVIEGLQLGFPPEIPSYGLSTEMIMKFFPFQLWKRFPEFRNNFFSVNRKFPERWFQNYGMFRNSGNFRNVPKFGSGKFSEKSFRNFPEQNTRITWKPIKPM